MTLGLRMRAIERDLGNLGNYMLPSDRGVEWTGAGVPGGIPSYTDVWVPSGNPYGGYSVDPALGNNSGDCSGVITSALDSAGVAAASSGVPKVVLLATGNYRTTNVVVFGSNCNKVVLRGSGMTGSGPGTRISLNVGNATPVIMSDAHPTFSGGAENYQSGWTYLVANSARGSNTITVNSTSGFAVGDVVTLDQSDDSSYVVLGDSTYWKRNSGSNPVSSTQRSMGQTSKIAAINGSVITLEDHLYRDFATAFVANLWRSAASRLGEGLKGAGVENIGLTGAGGGTGCVAFAHCENCWMLNVECDGSPNAWGLGGLGSAGMMLQFIVSYHCEIRRCYVHNALSVSPGGGAYGIVIVEYSSRCLIEDCITRILDKGINMIVSGGGNVVGYNYTDLTYFQNGANWWQENSIDACHTAFAHDDLIEGNLTENLGGDTTHGNSGWPVFFRNRATGRSSDGVPDQNVAACGVTGLSRYYSYVGNVIGPTGTIPNLQGSGPMYENYRTEPGHVEIGDGIGWAMWRVGRDADPQGNWDDGEARAQLLRHGNYDEYTNSIADWIDGESQNLSQSLYLSEKPAFFGSNIWPWIDPTGATAGDREKVLPAKARFDAGTPFA